MKNAKQREKLEDPEYREKVNAKAREKVTCPHCGNEVVKNYLKKHQQTKKCLACQ